MQRPSNRRGFTLIELLVVVGIIAVLMSILFPVTKRVREQARRAHCASNLRQIHQGALAYASRYDGALPGVVYPFLHDAISNEAVGQFWANAMHDEMFSLIDGRMYKCPSDDSISPYVPVGSEDWRTVPPYKPWHNGINHTSYIMFMGVSHHAWSFLNPGDSESDPNIYKRFPPPISPTHLKNRRGCIYDNFASFWQRSAPIHPANVKEIGSPNQILMMDRWYSKLQTGHYGTYLLASSANLRLFSNHWYPAYSSSTSPTLVYGEGVNCLLADGSVRWMHTKGESPADILVRKVQYHYDAAGDGYQIFVDMDLDPKRWAKK